jgi:hypothetical protein
MAEGGWRQRVDPNALLIGISVAIATIVIGTGVAIYVTADGSTDESRASGLAPADVTVTTSPRASSTTTTAAPSSTTLPTTGGSAGPGGGSTGSRTQAPPPPPTPRATADPQEPPYQPVPVPVGVSATIDGCRWLAGQLEAWGTITNHEEDGSWLVDTVYWLQNDREIASADGEDWLLDEALPGQTAPWRFAVPAPIEPLDLRCAIEIF